MAMADCFVFVPVKGGFTLHAFLCRHVPRTRGGAVTLVLPEDVHARIAEARKGGFMVIKCPCTKGKLKEA